MDTMRRQQQRWRHRWETGIEWLLAGAALVAVLTTLGIAAVLVAESLPFFRVVSWRSFLTDTQWTPLFAEPRFGIGVLLSGTITSSAVALAVAIPCGTWLAMYLSEFATGRFRESVKPILELLAGVPTVVFGYFALYTVTPLLQKLWPALPGFNLLSAGLVMGVMIVPYVASLSEDALRAVPMSLREGAYALGATRLQVAWQVVLPAAFSGVAASYVLGISRAIGETMIVAIAAGQQPRLTFNPLEPAATVTTYIVQVSKGDVPYGSLSYRTIFAAALVLFLLTLVFNLAADWIRRRQRLHGRVL
jgi:phosphate ABC transporter, permease protein PstC